MREALVVACDNYEDSGLRRLRSPVHDAHGLVRVLSNPAIGDYQVRPLINRPSSVVSEEIEDFFADRRLTDLLLLYFACHGIKDEGGRLYFAASNTRLQRLATTGISSVFVNEQIDRSRSRRKVLLLDCCYSGAFVRGLAPREAGGGSVDVKERFEGRGLAVITASDAMEYAWEKPGELTVDAGRLSVFSAAVIRGLETGEADRDGDDQISIADLYDYVFEQVRQEMPGQTPTRSDHGVQGELIIARRAQTPRHALLPRELRQALGNPLPGIRVGAVDELRERLLGTEPELALAAQQALERLERDDESDRVRAAAEGALQERLHIGREAQPRNGLSRSDLVSGQATHLLTATEPPRIAIKQSRGGEDTTFRSRGTDFEIGLQWDSARDGFVVSLREDGALQSSGTVLRIDVGELARLRTDEPAYGGALTQMVLRATDIAPAYLHARASAERSDRELRLRLQIDAPPRFHALRWELLRDPESGEPIATRSNVLFSRYLSSPGWRPIPTVTRQGLRALIVVAGPWDIPGYRSQGRRFPPIQVEEELKRARAALADFQVVGELVSGTATLANIMEALHPGIDVLYLVCYGTLLDDIPQLYLEERDGTTDVIDGKELAEQLSKLERPPTVVMLSPCQAASAGTEARSVDGGQLSALGPPLAAAGVATVVGMQADVSVSTAVTFAPIFLAAVAEHGFVDEAMAAARRAIRNEKDWWVPVLFSRLRSGRTYLPPGFGEQRDEAWKTLEAAFEMGRLTPIIGPRLTDPILGSLQDVARRWVQRWSIPVALHEQGNLARVAQYLSVHGTLGLGRWLQLDLLDEMRQRQRLAGPGDVIWTLPEALVEDNDPGPAISEVGRRLREIDENDPHGVLAALPVSVYITTGWTDLLTEALWARGRWAVTMTFPWSDSAWDRMGRVDRIEPPTVERPLVYHLTGRLADPDSLVLSEDDHFAWSNAWSTRHGAVPSCVLRALTGQLRLFLGYRRLDDWDFRIVFQGIKSLGGSTLLGSNSDVLVLPSPEERGTEPETAQEFGMNRLLIYWGESQDFFRDLTKRTKFTRQG